MNVQGVCLDRVAPLSLVALRQGSANWLISLRLHVIVGEDDFGIFSLHVDLRARHLNLCCLPNIGLLMNVQGVCLDRVAPLSLVALRVESAYWLITLRLHVIVSGHHKANIFLLINLRACHLPSFGMIAWKVA